MKFYIKVEIPVAAMGNEQSLPKRVVDLQATCKSAWMDIIPSGVFQMLYGDALESWDATPENMKTYDIWMDPIIKIVFIPLSTKPKVDICYKRPAMANGDSGKPRMYELVENIHRDLATRMEAIASAHFA